MDGTIVMAIVLAAFGFFSIWENLNLLFFQFGRPLMTGTVTGILVGDLKTGLAIGATLELAALGVYTYGGASIPDYASGAILGTYFANQASLSPQAAIGLAVPIALLLTQLDILARMANLFFQHRADAYVKSVDLRRVGLMNMLGTLSWGLSRAIPIFFGVWLGSGPVKAAVNESPQWLLDGLQTAGGILPALGIAMLLRLLPLRQYWPFLVIGFIVAAYLKVNLVGVALLGLAMAALVYRYAGGEEAANVAAAAEEEPAAEGRITRRDLRRVFLRYLLWFQSGWNYERMQGLGYAHVISPVMEKLYPDEGVRRQALTTHLQFFNTNPLMAAPILGANIAVEEKNEEPEFPERSVTGLKTGMMGPFAGIGDSFFFAICNTIVFSVGASLALKGSIVGPVIVFLYTIIFFTAFRWWSFVAAYRRGVRLVGQLAGGMLRRLTDAASILGLAVVGGLIPTIINTKVAYVFHSGRVKLNLQDQLDNILPALVPVLIVALVYFALSRRVRPTWAILGLLVLGVVLSVAGILKYPG